MKFNRNMIPVFLRTFFEIYGVLGLVFIIRNLFPQYGGNMALNWLEILSSIFSALIFAIIHTIVLSEGVCGKSNHRKRVIAGAILAALAGGSFAFYLDIPGAISQLFTSVKSASAAVIISEVLCCIISTVLWLFMEYRNIKAGKKYDEALNQYKKRIRAQGKFN